MRSSTYPSPPAAGAFTSPYDASNSTIKCLLSPPLHIFQTFIDQAVCHLEMDQLCTPALAIDKKSWQSIQESVCSLFVILPTVLGFTFSRIYCQQLPLRATRRFLVEFLLIVVPLIMNVTVTCNYNYHYCMAACLLVMFHLWRSRFWERAPTRTFDVGKRVLVFTLLRSTAYTGVCAGILAVDFPLFPKDFRKSRRFGASIMDVGIGLFVWTMGMVSHRARAWSDLRKLPKVVVPLLVLGLGRTLVITMIDYHQDEHEYGTHLNAFFTLAFTKLFGTLLTLLVRSDEQLLPLSLGILVLHELLLQLGLSDFVMSNDVTRDNLLVSNREGLSAILGCVALYLASMYFAKWYTSWQQLSYAEMGRKLRYMLIIALCGWSLVLLSAYAVGIARVTFNAGYCIWLFTLNETLLLVYAFLFELALPAANEEQQPSEPSGDATLLAKWQITDAQLPAFVQALNMNGLTHFMLSNFLTGLVNLTLQPHDCSGAESVLILTLYMLASAGPVYVLYRRHIRIA